MTPREETARIIILVPNEGLNDSSRVNCKNNIAAVGRLSDTTKRAYKGIITVNIQEVEPSQGYSKKIHNVNS